MKNREVSGLQGTSQNVRLQNNKEVLFIRKNLMCCQVSGALDRTKCTLAHAYVRSIIGSALKRTSPLNNPLAQAQM
jgi:hypothetical protein